MLSRTNNRAIKDDFGIPLQSSGRTLWNRKYSGSVATTFILEKTST
jgi:hypothetical protein